ncbi:protein-tyrosine kinase [Bifidobacterium eulemuris]|uniref:non-specific protein-tyrosine kinase n=1 Tax=Bifidobacterium eulemuris TaxID=1765219 RepID=A0A261GBL8_9BIFI|nr:polysaccharide biosynthesis tyrosine autokinase [Bifidobacterium eulemuris]OZG68565.1 protein-tyrosine kinase [Bifidobacterium eulemuris]
MTQEEMEASEEQGVTLADLLMMIRKHVIMVVVVFVVVLAAVAAYTFTTPKKYSATAELLAMSGQGAVSDTASGNLSQFNTASSYINSQIETYPELAKTETVLDTVIDDLSLNMTVSEVAELITVSNPSGTLMVDITAETVDPELSQQLANAVADSLSDQVSTSLGTLDEDVNPVMLSVVQRAQVPQSASSPRVALYLAVGALAGLILGVCCAVVREMLNTKVEESSDVRSIVGASSLGTVPQDELLEGSRPMVVAQPGGPLAEEFRRIHTNLSFLRADRANEQGQVLVFTSSSPAEGKTTTTINVAAALAEDGAKVLLIDADLRHPSVAHHLDIEGHVGLAHVLSGQMMPKDVVQSYWKPNLHVLAAGKRPANPSILLNSETMAKLVSQAVTQYDYVIIDTAPLSVSNDASVFGRWANGVILVAGKGVCEKKDLAEAYDSLESAGVPVLGFVFNFADPKKKREGSYYYLLLRRGWRPRARQRQNTPPQDRQPVILKSSSKQIRMA